MRLRVRTPDGELTFPSRAELVRAFEQGLVEPTDEVQEEGSSRWRRARELPELAHVKPARRKLSPRLLSTAVAVALAVASLYFLTRDGWAYLAVGFVLAFLVVFMVSNITLKAFQRRAR